ncbi:MAG: hypothetical protein FWE90_09025 [Defluviitaleaceae bacterium]|nr:hypothetical protein [Defluviitaleaceae bacterium]
MGEVIGIMLGVAFYVGFFYLIIYMTVIIPRKKKRMLEEYSMQLESAGFVISKRIVTIDYMQNPVRDPNVGLWVDYHSQKFAVRTSQKEIDPQIYNFSDLKNIENVDGARGYATTGGGAGIGVRVGMIGIGGGRMNSQSEELAYDTSIRIVIGGGLSGIHTVKLDLWKTNTSFLSADSEVRAKSKAYQRILECKRDIYNELINIMEINNG